MRGELQQKDCETNKAHISKHSLYSMKVNKHETYCVKALKIEKNIKTFFCFIVVKGVTWFNITKTKNRLSLIKIQNFYQIHNQYLAVFRL